MYIPAVSFPVRNTIMLKCINGVSNSLNIGFTLWIFYYFGVNDYILAKPFNPSNYVYEDLKAVYGIVEPFDLPGGGDKVIDFDAIACTTCPRFFYPVCGKDEITYVNPCILRCINKTTADRNGQCIYYRRKNSRYPEPEVRLRLPTKWRLENVTSSSLRENNYFDEVILRDSPYKSNGPNPMG
ncbi:uncharacterized protein LOC113499524 [Trichoplusia ni]|uniref:Uncharacterized protein LOC113499524 n=1 Tax=Trichoplusia ni TaxID=7111 RepID=A0A7E5W583_TRINI|nr:uncharacterized protein LOC113499524 [Trichoplusia ni]